jgi:two-component system cell cycle sensor histidine kinase/response regulator CckA
MNRRPTNDEFVQRRMQLEAKSERLEMTEKSLEESEQHVPEKKQAQKALGQSEIDYREIVHSANSVILRLDTQGNVTFINQFGQNFFGYAEDEILGKNVIGRIVPETDSAGKDLAVMIREIGRHPEKYAINENENIRRNGERVWLAWTNRAIRDKSGRVTEVLCIGNDITQRKFAENALRESEEKYRLLVENANDAIFIAQDEVLKFCNHQTEKMTGYSKKELAKIPFANLICPADRQMVLDRHKKRLSGENPPSTYSFRIITKAGQESWVQLSTVRITWNGRPATLNFLRDITVQKKLESQLHNAQKMEALGTLAGGIAHDFNNLLMIIQGNTSLMLYDTETSHPHYEYLNTIEKQIKSAAELTNQLLGYARKGKYQVRTLNLNPVVEETLEGLSRTRKEITIQLELSENVFAVLADRGQIEQVLLNLFVNAADAMPDGGRLLIKTLNVTHKDMVGKLYEPKIGNYVQLTVTDTGFGIDKVTQDRIFDPFFTTKEMGRGTGLGLASVYGIIKGHGGYIDVDSEKDHGTTFTIYLPAADQKVQEAERADDQMIEKNLTLLLVDDEAMVLDVGCRLLQKMGYTVLKAESGTEAVKVYKKNKDGVDLVILDMILPELSGGEVYDQIKAINPLAKVLLSSGYSVDGKATEILKRGCNGFIQKPFNMKELSAKIKEIMA